MRLTGSSANNNELLDYIQSLGKDADLLTNNASQEVLDSMTAFIDRCMGARPSPPNAPKFESTPEAACGQCRRTNWLRMLSMG